MRRCDWCGIAINGPRISYCKTCRRDIAYNTPSPTHSMNSRFNDAPDPGRISMNVNGYFSLVILSAVCTLLIAFIFSGLWFCIGLIFELFFGYKVIQASQNNRKPEPEPEPLVIGRTQKDWYETIKDIGPEITEELMIGPLNGLERDQESAWNPETLMGKELWKHLRKEWYPDRFCKYCNNEGCKETCGKAATAKAEEEWRFLVQAPRKKAIDKADIYVDGYRSIIILPTTIN